MEIAGDRPPRYGKVIPNYRGGRCLPVFAHPPRRDTYRNGVMKHPRLKFPP